MSKFLSLIEENTPSDTHEVDEYTKEGLEQLEGYMAQANLNLGYAGELLADLNDPIVEKRAGELGAEIQKDLHNFMDNFGGTSVEEAPEEDYEFTDKGRQKKIDKFNKNSGNITGTLATAQELRAADPDPKRPSRGVKQINKEVDNLGKAVAKGIKRVTKMIK
jgi:hypothetical protein